MMCEYDIPATWITVINNFGGWSFGLVVLWCAYRLLASLFDNT